MSINNIDEPSNSPIPDQWYTLNLGSSFKDHQPSSKFCTLRYEFKPASIDKTQPGALHKSKDNKINVEFHNNQLGKSKVTFEGTSEDYKENDAVLFFDGHSFRLERLHRAVKRLRHVRLHGESSAGAAVSTLLGGDPGSSPMRMGFKAQPQNLNARPSFTPPPPVSVEMERIDIGDPVVSSVGKPKVDRPSSTPPPPPPAQQAISSTSPDLNDFNLEAQLDIMGEDEDEEGAFDLGKTNSGEKPIHTGIDINLPQHNTDDDDDEIADVDVNDDNGGMVRNAAEALWEQVNAEGGDGQTSSSCGSSESESSESSSESGSSSSGSDSSEAVSVNSI